MRFCFPTKRSCLQHRPQIFVERPKTSMASRSCFSALKKRKLAKTKGDMRFQPVIDWIELGFHIFLPERKHDLKKQTYRILDIQKQER